MAADPNIFQQYLKPVRSMQDYSNDMDTAEANALTLAGQRQTAADDQAVRTAYQQSGGDQNKLVQALQQGGQYKAAQALQDKMLTQKKTQGDIDKQSSDLIDVKLKQSRQFLDGVTTPEQYIAWHEANHADPVLGPVLAARGVTQDTARASIQDALQQPGGFERLLNQSKMGVEKFAEMNKPSFQTRNTGATTDTLQIPGMGGAATVISSIKNTQSPDSIASTAQQTANRAQAERHFQVTQASAGEDSVMDPLAVRMAAQQYLAGDTSALQNFGRGAQGAKNLNAVRLEITKQATAAGLTGADVAAKIAEFGGIKAGQRTAGTRSANIEIAANEAAQLAPLALDASQKVARSGFLPFGKAQIMFDANTNDPNLRQFAMANNALVNAYGQVMSRGGKATESDKKHAEDLLSTTFDQPSYAAAVQQLQAEIKAAQKAPREVRKNISSEVGGRSSAPSGDIHSQADAILRGK